MTSDEARTQILGAIEAAGHVVTHCGSIDKQFFGNFLVGFVAAGQPHRLVNDRGQIIHDWGDGFREGRVVIDRLADLDADALATAILGELQ